MLANNRPDDHTVRKRAQIRAVPGNVDRHQLDPLAQCHNRLMRRSGPANSRGNPVCERTEPARTTAIASQLSAAGGVARAVRLMMRLRAVSCPVETARLASSSALVRGAPAA